MAWGDDDVLVYADSVHVSNDDIAAAKRAWLDAREGGAPWSRIEQLQDDYQRLVVAQARQIADHFRGSRLAR
jgi:hypothetical protein